MKRSLVWPALLWATTLVASPAQALQVVATLPSLAALAREVAGSYAAVECLLSPRQDPHYADARPNLILSLHRADLLVVNGLELEVGWLPGLARQARNPKIQTGAAGYFDASMAVLRLQVPGQVDRAMGDIHPGGNPHFHLDPRAAAHIAVALGKSLSTLDPAHAAEYAKNASVLSARLRALAAEIAQRFAALPEAERRLAVYHDSLVYLVDWLHLKQVIAVEPRPGIPPDPGHLAKVVATVRTTGARALVQEEYYPRAASDQVAKLTGMRVAVVAGGPQFSANQRYEDYVRGVAKTLYEALHGGP
ncbi:MAG: zinc ABC transporter substrate-binding protein [Deltaproteobacteria bacterium]|nr:zinc ABC transporter substrate-binding protein [Deltaproteobacteria bacterium]